jgi:ketosteroid isomerase-like protein
MARIKGNVVATVIALALAASPALAADGAKDFADSVGAAWVKAMKAADLDAVVALYADDAVAWFPDEAEQRGTAAIREGYKGMFDMYTIVDATLTHAGHVADATHRTNWGSFSLTLKQKSDGKVIPLTGRYTDVQEKRSGKWVYVVDHASATPPPTAAPAK